jgi:hypothetical protein
LEFQKKWIKKKIELVRKHNLQGINMNFNDALDEGSAEVFLLTDLVKNFAEKLRDRESSARFTFNAPWAAINPIGSAVDNRNYDYLQIYDVVDHFIVFR